MSTKRIWFFPVTATESITNMARRKCRIRIEWRREVPPLFRVGWIFEPLHDKDWLNQRYLHYTDQQFNTYMISSIYCDDVWQITKWKITFQNDLQRHIRSLMSYEFPSLYKLIYYLYLMDWRKVGKDALKSILFLFKWQ